MDDNSPFNQERECPVCEYTVPMLFLLGGDPTERCLECHTEARNSAPRNEDAEWDEWVLGTVDPEGEF